MNPSSDQYEKLGAFYLGRDFDPERGQPTDDLLLYDSKDLTTHAVCVGMTGSGKTGLCVSLLEEAAIDGVPAIIIDPKGDLGNLLLTFPDLEPGDFEPWVDAEEARRKGMSTQAFAADRANLWRNGLEEWGQDGARIRRLRETVDMAIYTPGSDAGLQLQVMRSFAAPPEAIRDDFETMQTRVAASVSGLLGLLRIDADPIRSREHILLSNIIDRAWRAGRDLDLPSLIQQIQNPPFDRIGIMDIEAIFPAKERFGLAMALNNLLASPAFAAWMQGEPLDVNRLLYTPQGKPRISILSIAHLSDPERMFFVTLIFNEMIAWIRSQPGTNSLRALLYMNEVFGYLPPTANPPSKMPLLTLLKQARAYGLGLVLATQNPVDLDYKALSNAGTWFLGRLQTERDKMRVLDGLEGATGAAGMTFDRPRIERLLSGLSQRVFLMNNVHDAAPTLFQTRWAMSYLRGPLTRTQIRTLMEPRKNAAPEPPAPAAAAVIAATAAAPAAYAAPAQTGAAPAAVAGPPTLPPDVPQYFLPPRGMVPGGKRLVFRPSLVGVAKVHFVNSPAKLDHWSDLALLAPLGDGGFGSPWDQAEVLENAQPDLRTQWSGEGSFVDLPVEAGRAKTYSAWSKDFVRHVYATQEVKVLKSAQFKMCSGPGEAEGDFRARLAHAVREHRDAQLHKLRKKYEPKVARLRDRIEKSELRVEKEAEQYKQAGLSTAISLGSTLLGSLFGRRSTSATITGAGTAARGASRTAGRKSDIERAKADSARLQAQLGELEQEFQVEVENLEDKTDVDAIVVEEILVKPRKSDTAVRVAALAWTPWLVGGEGIATPYHAV